jgi:hypothetical protein
MAAKNRNAASGRATTQTIEEIEALAIGRTS